MIDWYVQENGTGLILEQIMRIIIMHGLIPIQKMIAIVLSVSRSFRSRYCNITIYQNETGGKN